MLYWALFEGKHLIINVTSFYIISYCSNSELKEGTNNNHLMVVQDWCRTVFQIEDPDPYPLSNGGQT